VPAIVARLATPRFGLVATALVYRVVPTACALATLALAAGAARANRIARDEGT
jgi:hypothetical protein